MLRSAISSVVAIGCLSLSAQAQALPIPLNYNWNGIVHLGEAGQPDDPNGFRSISDRALDWSQGVPNDPLLSPYQLVSVPGALDMVHLGNRNTVDNGNMAFDAVPDFDNIGIQPNWLLNPDQTGPQVTVLASPLPIAGNTSANFLYQISNGGGSFQVTFRWFAGGSHTTTLVGGDWFGGSFAGTQDVDAGNPGANLSITEGRVDLSAFSGQLLTQIEFSSRSNTNAGYGILAANLEYLPQVRRVNQIELNYNWNGIVHAGESGQPDNLIGFRSISDRALNFSAGVPNLPLLAPYRLVAAPFALDLVHLGNRNSVDGGRRAFDPAPNTNDIGVQPAWLANPDQTGPQTTVLAAPILLDAASRGSLLFQISNGGGSFEVAFLFQSGAPAVYTLSGGDWFGGTLAGTDRTDFGNPGANLSLTERSVDLSAHAGRTLTAISFQNQSNFNAGYAIVAMNVSGCLSCLSGTPGSVQFLGGGNGPALFTNSNGNLGADLDWTVAGATPNAPLGFMALGLGSTSLPLGSVVPGCLGTVHVPNPVAIYLVVDATGAATARIQAPTSQGLCGVQITGQYLELVTAACSISLSSAISITIGN